MSESLKYSGDVIALTLFDNNTLVNGGIVADTRVRIGVRRAGSNLTHPDIVSVPTQRIPLSLAQEILGARTTAAEPEGLVKLTTRWSSNRSANGHNPVVYAVESLLSRKLGVAEYLESDRLIFEATPAICILDWARYPNLIDATDAPYPDQELLRMINIRVHITEGADLFPALTESYDHSKWVTVHEYNAMMDGKDVSRVGLDGFKFCVDGLCVASTNTIIESEFTPRHVEESPAHLHLAAD